MNRRTGDAIISKGNKLFHDSGSDNWNRWVILASEIKALVSEDADSFKFDIGDYMCPVCQTPDIYCRHTNNAPPNTKGGTAQEDL